MKEILIQIKLNKKLTRMRRKNVNNGFIYKTNNAACISIILNKNIELSILFKLCYYVSTYMYKRYISRYELTINNKIILIVMLIT